MAPGGGLMTAGDADSAANEVVTVDMTGVPWSRRAITQVVILSVGMSFIPGAFNALTSMAGGIGDPNLSAQSFVWLYGVFSAASIFAPAVVNLVGARFALFVGGLGYPFYVLNLLMVGKLQMWNSRMILFAGAVEGFGAALLWTGQGALTFSYAPARLRGTYFAVFWIIFNSGSVVQSFTTIFLLNLQRHDNVSNISMFIVFIVVQLLGCALFLTLSPLKKVVRPDGNLVVVETQPAILPEVRGMVNSLLNPRTLALVPMMLYSNWCYDYQFNQYNEQLFDTPTKGLNATFYWAAQMIAAYFLAFKFLDSPKKPLRARAKVSLAVVTVFTTVAWLLGTVANYKYQPLPDELRIRFDEARYLFPFAVYVLWGAADALVQVWVNWCLSQLADCPTELSRYAGVYKIFNAFGSLMGSQLNTAPRSVQLWINVGLFVVSVPPAIWVTSTFKFAKDTDPSDNQ